MKDLKWLTVVLILLSVIVTVCILNDYNNTDTNTLIENSINIDNSDQQINWENYPYTTIQLSSSLELTNSGVYHLKGTIYDGNISINPSADASIKIILDNVMINNTTGPAITCYSGDDLVIELIGDNIIADGTTYLDTYDEDVTGAIYSKADLTFEGNGSLTVTGNHEDAIISKDDLTFRSGTYNITSQDDGVRGKDSVHIVDGSFSIYSTADSIKATNELDPTKGFVLIESGDFNLDSGAKGIKATKYLLIDDGTFSLKTNDDAIHSDNYIGIKKGRISINSGDDGIHANREIRINGANITILKSYEGIEAQKITIKDGLISITSFDDGFNAGGGADQSSTKRTNGSPFDADENCEITIAGGDIYINASGDGIDSNGWLYLNGGKIIIDGPADNGNAALDSGLGIMTNGAEVLALGYSGMAEAPSQTSVINSVNIKLDKTYPKETSITITDSEDNIIISHVSAKSFNHFIVSSPEFTLGNSFKLYFDESFSTEFTISNIVTNIRNNYQNKMMPMPRR